MLPSDFNSLRAQLVSAVISVSQCVGRWPPGGVPFPMKSVCSATIGDGWRIDLDNLNGWNLRQ